jgi:hypothetical protein
MKVKMIASILAITMLSVGLCVAADDNEEKRDKTRKMAAQTLQDLYKLEPASQAAIQKSAGYAVFNNTGVNLLLARRVAQASPSTRRAIKKPS